MKREDVNRELRKRIQERFDKVKKEDVSTLDIDIFMREINPTLQDFAHNQVKSSGLMPHCDRKSYKDSLRLYILKIINKRYPDMTLEYLWCLLKEKGLKGGKTNAKDIT